MSRLVLASMGARAYGRPIETSLPALQIAAMSGVTWPEHLTERTPA